MNQAPTNREFFQGIEVVINDLVPLQTHKEIPSRRWREVRIFRRLPKPVEQVFFVGGRMVMRRCTFERLSATGQP